ncbi:family 78 glycoside hydrolase catalytic domain [Streptomyces pseudogriseolus]|uniref:family 78 glycoside hydrolase catalytic domain n=1 Tax=Streptomyces pseudogriseolus TaxID=36817 RepID=UPI003FA27678
MGVSEPRPGVFVFDLGQNMVGSVRLRVVGAAGTVVRLRHAEVLQGDGICVYGELAYREGGCVHVVPSKWWVTGWPPSAGYVMPVV